MSHLVLTFLDIIGVFVGVVGCRGVTDFSATTSWGLQ